MPAKAANRLPAGLRRRGRGGYSPRMSSTSSQTVGEIIQARWIVPVEPEGVVLEDHAVALADGRIAAVLPAAEARLRYPSARVTELPHHVLIPGLVNLHTHAAMSLMRGFADDLSLMDWLNTRIWPAEAAHASESFVHDGTLLACAEMLRGGVTCFNDMYFYPDAAARAALASGMRAALGMIVVGFPSGYASDTDDYLAKGLAMRDAFKGEALLSYCFAPHAPYSVDDAAFARVLTLAEQLECPIHCHVHETDAEIQDGLQRFGLRPLARLENLGLLGPDFIAVHAVHLLPGEIDTLARRGVHVAHCPTSNLKLGSGIAPVSALLAVGVNVGLGTDGAASNNRLDVLRELRLAALLAKGVSGDAAVLPAHAALHMATLGAARALGLDDSIGSIAPGKAADLAALDVSDVAMLPLFDPLSHLVYVAGREQVSHVWINGEARVAEGRLTGMDVNELRSKANYWQSRLRKTP
jgi:5-methylthioadenosine/S-adenosylhomocysteine deaminase